MGTGVVVTFDAERGFGFLRSPDCAEDVFVHVSAVAGGRPLRPGQHVRFTAEATERGPRAVRVEPGRKGLAPALAGTLGLASALGFGTLALAGLGLPWVGAWVLAINLTTPAFYAWDKHRAVRGRRRVPEAVLLGLAAAGGSPAAIVSMALLRHKTRKLSFRLILAAIVVGQLLLILGIGLSRRGDFRQSRVSERGANA